MARAKKDKALLRHGYKAVARELHARNPHRARAVLSPLREAFQRQDPLTLSHIDTAIEKLEAKATDGRPPAV